MSDDYILVDGAGELMRKLTGFPKEALDRGVEASSKVMLHKFQEYQKYKSLTRAEVYGKTFESERQRRYFFYALRTGKITVPYKRTQTLRRGWQIVSKGVYTMVTNQVKYAPFVMVTGSQNQLLKTMGWTTVRTRIAEVSDRMDKAFDGEVKKVMRIKKL